MFTNCFMHRLQTCAQYSFRLDKKLSTDMQIKKNILTIFV